EHGIAFDHTIGLLKDEQLSKLEHIIHNPVEHSIPGFMVNQRKESVSGEDKHFVMTGLDLNTRNVIKKLQEMRAYRGLRHSWGLTVRGQRTRSSGRKQGKKARYRMNKK
ncbi:MAG TPA: 30S ribosomal protein S13, partial [archaeon]|nr:30S ribosomal protein S13 [archaeon]